MAVNLKTIITCKDVHQYSISIDHGLHIKWMFGNLLPGRGLAAWVPAISAM
jgi:hypothetical protein